MKSMKVRWFPVIVLVAGIGLPPRAGGETLSEADTTWLKFLASQNTPTGSDVRAFLDALQGRNSFDNASQELRRRGNDLDALEAGEDTESLARFLRRVVNDAEDHGEQNRASFLDGSTPPAPPAPVAPPVVSDGTTVTPPVLPGAAVPPAAGSLEGPVLPGLRTPATSVPAVTSRVPENNVLPRIMLDRLRTGGSSRRPPLGVPPLPERADEKLQTDGDRPLGVDLAADPVPVTAQPRTGPLTRGILSGDAAWRAQSPTSMNEATQGRQDNLDALRADGFEYSNTQYLSIQRRFVAEGQPAQYDVVRGVYTHTNGLYASRSTIDEDTFRREYGDWHEVLQGGTDKIQRTMDRMVDRETGRTAVVQTQFGRQEDGGFSGQSTDRMTFASGVPGPENLLFGDRVLQPVLDGQGGVSGDAGSDQPSGSGEDSSEQTASAAGSESSGEQASPVEAAEPTSATVSDLLSDAKV